MEKIRSKTLLLGAWKTSQKAESLPHVGLIKEKREAGNKSLDQTTLIFGKAYKLNPDLTFTAGFSPAS